MRPVLCSLRRSRLGGTWLAMLAVLTLLTSPLLTGRAHADTPTCGTCPPSAAAAHAQETRRTHSDARCSDACALAGQLLVARAEPPTPPRSAIEAFSAPLRQLAAAGSGPEQDTPPPR